MNLRVWLGRAALTAAIGAVAVFAWQRFASNGADEGLASGNGRIEAVEIDIAARVAGRVREILVAEGDFVAANQVLARIDADMLEAQRRQAEAQLRQARSAVAGAASQIAQRESDKASAQAVLAQREVELAAARAQLERTLALAAKGFISSKAEDDDRARVDVAQAAAGAARAQVAAAEAAVASSRAQAAGAESSVAAARANVERIHADLADTVLRAPRDGRVQVRIAQPGEVVAAGGKLLSLVDLTDVYMTFFLPTGVAGRLAIGDEARLVLDAAPEHVIPASVSFVSAEAQFTPRTVETALEREKLMFRVRARIDPALLRRHITRVKTGLPGVAYVRLDPSQDWPARLRPKLPE